MSAAREGQTVVVIGGSAGVGLETARLARAEGGESPGDLARIDAPSAHVNLWMLRHLHLHCHRR